MFDPTISPSMAEAQKREQQGELRRRREARRMEGISLLSEREREGELAIAASEGERWIRGGELVEDVGHTAESAPASHARHSDVWAPVFLAAVLLAALLLKVGRGEDGN